MAALPITTCVDATDEPSALPFLRLGHPHGCTLPSYLILCASVTMTKCRLQLHMNHPLKTLTEDAFISAIAKLASESSSMSSLPTSLASLPCDLSMSSHANHKRQTCRSPLHVYIQLLATLVTMIRTTQVSNNVLLTRVVFAETHGLKNHQMAYPRLSLLLSGVRFHDCSG